MAQVLVTLGAWTPIVAVPLGLLIYVLERGPSIAVKWIEFAELREARRARKAERRGARD
jgi:hypothetical protein